ncbi:1333_t:CDS:1, partial [Diversispora eburnea]
SHNERDIRNILDFPKITIHDTIERYRNENQISSAPKSDRPPKLSERSIRQLINIVKEDQ